MSQFRRKFIVQFHTMFSEPLLVLQMDSMKSSIKALTKDKKDYENKYKESQEELAKKEKLLTNCQGGQKLCITCHNEHMKRFIRTWVLKNSYCLLDCPFANAHKSKTYGNICIMFIEKHKNHE